jgi:hypothetical protein
MTIHDKLTLSNAITLALLAGFEIDGPARLRKGRWLGMPLDAEAIRYKGELVTDLEVDFPVYTKGSVPPGKVDPWPADALKFSFKIGGERRSIGMLLEVNTATGELRVVDVPTPDAGWTTT